MEAEAAAEVAGVAERRPPAGPLEIAEALKVVGAQSPSGDAALVPVVAAAGSPARDPDDATALP